MHRLSLFPFKVAGDIENRRAFEGARFVARIFAVCQRPFTTGFDTGDQRFEFDRFVAFCVGDIVVFSTPSFSCAGTLIVQSPAVTVLIVISFLTETVSPASRVYSAVTFSTAFVPETRHSLYSTSTSSVAGVG